MIFYNNCKKLVNFVCFLGFLTLVQSNELIFRQQQFYVHSNRTSISPRSRQTSAGPYVDASRAFGLTSFPRWLKYGGPVVADLDGNGWLDILISYHVQKSGLYFNNQGVFKKTSWSLQTDLHGLLPVRASPRRKGMHFLASPGGGGGNNLKPPIVFLVSPQRNITNVSANTGLDSANGRGRAVAALRMNLEHRGGQKYSAVWPDLLFTHKFLSDQVPLQDIFEGTRKRVWKEVRRSRFLTPNSYSFVSDIKNNNRMHVITWSDLMVHRLVGSFRLLDVSNYVLPMNLDRRGVVGVAELDFDNDGDMDLVVTRSDTVANKWLTRLKGDKQFTGGDYIFRNDNGRYTDVTKSSGIKNMQRSGRPGTGSRGVTVGDFDNDGWMDIIIVGFASDDMDAVLWNNKDGTFSVEDAGFDRASDVAGDHPVAADVNRDGRLEIVLSEGDWGDTSLGGSLRIMKLRGRQKRKIGNSLLVRVGNSPRRLATSLHASVVVVVNKGKKMFRKVSSPGTCVSNSLVDLVHFGIGASNVVRKVTVTWSNGEVARKFNVRSKFISIGNFASIG